MSPKQLLIAASFLGLLSVAFGAFGAHALKDLLEAANRTETFELAVRYQFYHTLVLLFLGLNSTYHHKVASLLFLTGIVLFSGSLYFLSLTNSTALIFVTPVGGVFLVAGWARLLWGFIKK
jgi:uncharacterized membrane protein YgdD (TMEM256/DUF423 family)